MFPAVLYPADPRMRLFHEVQSGPVVPVCPFDELEEPIPTLSSGRVLENVMQYLQPAGMGV